MKKVHLHGELGKLFGKVWNIDIDTPAEALSALFANNLSIKKYLEDKNSEGITYGVKKECGEIINNKDSLLLKSDQDFHIFPVPQGAASFALSIASTAASAAINASLSKKMAKLQERNTDVLTAQTQSYLYTGKQNRFQQGGTIPLGYGRMIIGTNVISSCIVNYDYDSENNKIFNFTNGLYSLVPLYYDEAGREKYGPIVSFLGNKTFDGDSEFNVADPGYLFITNQKIRNKFGALDGLYGSYGNSTASKWESRSGFWEGKMSYSFDYFSSINLATLPSYSKDSRGNPTGNWSPLYVSIIDQKNYAIKEKDVEKSGFVCVQSDPILETEKSSEKTFYPIMFSEEADLMGAKFSSSLTNQENNILPIAVGERWINGTKDNGLGWFKLESAAIFKSIDLLCEGPIDGFANKNGKLVNISSHAKNQASQNPMRNAKDDYLQGVLLNGAPVKEVNYELELDSYNVNEFDIDIARNTEGEIGSNDQLPLKPQYMFVADTKEINKQLFGGRTLTKEVASSTGQYKQFKMKSIYSKGQTVLADKDGKKIKYIVQRDLSNRYEPDKNYSYQESFKKSEIYYIGSENSARFFVPGPGWKGVASLNLRKQDYKSGDIIKIENTEGQYKYGKITVTEHDFLGTFDQSLSYSGKAGKIVAYGTPEDGRIIGYTSLYEIKSGDHKAGDSIFDIAEKLVTENPDSKDEFYHYEILKDTFGLKELKVHPDDFDTTNDGGLWLEVLINSPSNIIVDGQTIVDHEIFSSAGGLIEGVDKALEEENYVSHTVINPMVEQVIVTLQVDELAYIYPGDKVNVTYEFGEWVAAFAGLITAYVTAASLDFSIGGIVGGVIGGAGIGLVVDENAEINMGESIDNSGETWPNRARFRIKYGNEGELMYTTDIHIYGVASSPYRKDVKLFFPKNPSKSNRIIKVYKLNREKNYVKEGEQSARYKETMSLAAVTEITPVKLNYPNSVVVGTRINARDFPEIPTRNYHVRLKKVAVPNAETYDPESRRYSLYWNGLFQGQESKDDKVPDSAKRWSDNPAWCMYDLLSNKDYGVGKFGITYKDIDRWTLYKLAKYCDEMIPTGYSSKYTKRNFTYKSAEDGGYSIAVSEQGEDFIKEFNYIGKKIALYYDDGTYDSLEIIGVKPSESKLVLKHKPLKDSGICAVEIDYPLVEPRYTFNAYIMQPSNAFKLINEFASVFRAFTYWSGGSINFFQDEEKESVMLFSNNNISKEGFAYSSTPKTSRINSCKIKYLDKYNDFRPKIEHHEDNESIKENHIIEDTLDGFGITSQGQAKRAVEFAVKSANLETEVITFKTNLLGSYLRPGDVFDVLDNKRTIGKFSGKIIDTFVSADGSVANITVDYPIPTYINYKDPKTWKKIRLFTPQQNETIESLDEKPDVSDTDINDIRKQQIQEYTVSNLDETGRVLTLHDNKYAFIPGDYTWHQALSDAEKRGGGLAIIKNDNDQEILETEIPADTEAWIGGYYEEISGKAVWYQNRSCFTENGDEILYSNWAPDYPMFDKEESLGNFIKAKGLRNLEDDLWMASWTPNLFTYWDNRGQAAWDINQETQELINLDEQGNVFFYYSNTENISNSRRYVANWVVSGLPEWLIDDISSDNYNNLILEFIGTGEEYTGAELIDPIEARENQPRISLEQDLLYGYLLTINHEFVGSVDFVQVRLKNKFSYYYILSDVHSVRSYSEEINEEYEQAENPYDSLLKIDEVSEHGQWLHDDASKKMGYILETKSTDKLKILGETEGTTFIVEDPIHLANKKQYKVISMTEESNGVFNIQGSGYNNDKFRNIEENASIKNPTSPVLFTEKSLVPPGDVNIYALDEDLTNDLTYGLTAEWKTDVSAARYRIQFYGQNNLIASFEVKNDPNKDEQTFSYRGEEIYEGGTYYVRIYSLAN